MKPDTAHLHKYRWPWSPGHVRRTVLPGLYSLAGFRHTEGYFVPDDFGNMVRVAGSAAELHLTY